MSDDPAISTSTSLNPSPDSAAATMPIPAAPPAESKTSHELEHESFVVHLHCPVCNCEYESPNRCAIMGICGHTVCEPCIITKGWKEPFFPCKICKLDYNNESMHEEKEEEDTARLTPRSSEPQDIFFRMSSFIRERWQMAGKSVATQNEVRRMEEMQLVLNKQQDERRHSIESAVVAEPEVPGTGGICARCGQEYQGHENTESSCFKHTGEPQFKAGWSTVWVILYKGGSDADKKKAERRRWACCPKKIIVGPYDELETIPHGYHI